jgi:glycosyltransferase involved in cell wall biosynthesis
MNAMRFGRWPFRRRQQRPSVDVLFYAPYVSELLRPGGSVPSGGAETQIVLIAKLLAGAGMRVAIVAYEQPQGLPAEVAGVLIVARPVRRRGGPLSRKLREVATLCAALGRVDAAVIVQRAMGIETSIVALYARATRRRFVYSSASITDFAPERLLERLSVALHSSGVLLAHAIVVQTEEQRALCKQRFRRNGIVIRSVAESAPLTDQPARAFLWIGRTAFYKQPLVYIELARALPEVQFEMVAVADPSPDGQSLYARVQEAAQRLSNLKLVAPRPRAQLAPLMAQAVAIVNTSQFEGMPNTLLEGWAHGVPALVFEHDPDGLVSRNALGGFAAGSPALLAELAGQMWRERHDRVDLAERCRAYVRREHAPARIAEQWHGVFASQMTSPRRNGWGR